MARKLLNRKNINPSAPIFTGKKYTETTGIQLFEYDKDESRETKNYSLEEFNGFIDDNKNHWLNIHGIHDVDKILKICQTLDIHDLVVQDILDINQRPKFQEFDQYSFMTIKSIVPATNRQIQTEQISFVLGKNYLVSFQEKKSDYFEHVRQRLRQKLGKVNARDTDYLLYLLLESILDNYFKTLDSIEQQMDSFGFIEINSDPSPAILGNIEMYKRELHQIKKTILPIKEFIIKIERDNNAFIHNKNLKYFYELKDMCLTLLDSCDHIDMRLESSINLFFSVQGHRMNEVIKILTVVSTIFIPLTFIAGVYGMNFINIPELSWKWGYLGFWVIIVLILIFMIFYFRRKHWF